MNRKQIFLLIFGALILPSACLANVGIPMVVLTFPAMVMALIFIVCLEWAIITNYVKGKRFDSASSYSSYNYFIAVLWANGVSTLVGLPLSWLPLSVTPFGWIWSWPLQVIYIGFILNFILAFFASIWIEILVLEKKIKNEPKEIIKRAVIKANSISYALLWLSFLIIAYSFSHNLEMSLPSIFWLFASLFLPVIIVYTFWPPKTGVAGSFLKFGIIALLVLILMQRFWIPNIFQPINLYNELRNYATGKEGAICDSHNPCADDYVCLSGRCVGLSKQQKNVRCNFDSECAGGYKCVNDFRNSECVKIEEQKEGSFCSFSDDCAPGYVCHLGRCISEKTRFCFSDNDCWRSYVCSEDNICVKELK